MISNFSEPPGGCLYSRAYGYVTKQDEQAKKGETRRDKYFVVCWSQTSRDSPGLEHKKDVAIAEWFTEEICLPPSRNITGNFVSNLVQVYLIITDCLQINS